jgi:hypothetical protein
LPDTAEPAISEANQPLTEKTQANKPKLRKCTMSNSIVMTSNYAVKDEQVFKASLIAGLGAESPIQTTVQKKLNELAVAADKSKMKDSEVSITAVITAQSTDSTVEAITLTVTDSLSTLSINQELSLSLDVTTTEAGKTDNGVPYSVSTSKSYPLTNSKSTGIVQVITALNSDAFTEGKAFDNQLISAEQKSATT